MRRNHLEDERRRNTQFQAAKQARSIHELQLSVCAIVVLTGATAVQALLEKKAAMTEIRGQWQIWQGRSVMPIFHPAYLLRHAAAKEGGPVELTRQDLSAVRTRLCER